ncbi:glycosyltransferase family 4 protein [Mycobacterium sp. UM_CSW]|uniref:glycosyltransferase family 4 protein n=1 Tax=Mycobacterium sp. UM_CSW TaxID=1370119 RepID=UPI0012682503|nr:glycosyltransferase family 4 protein [Mycobacterium sp. UM_CSW]
MSVVEISPAKPMRVEATPAGRTSGMRPSDIDGGPDAVMLVGPGARFLSAVGYHNAAIANAFARRGDSVSALLIRELCPRRFYPGRDRVGTYGPEALHLEGIPTCEGLDWYWGASIFRSIRFLLRRRPKVVLLQWWAALTAHSYLMVALMARLIGAPVVLEMHETTDVGEAAVPFVTSYARVVMRLLARLVSGVVVHSKSDIDVMQQFYPCLRRLPFSVVFPGPLEDVGDGESAAKKRVRSEGDPVRFLFFGVIRPYKGIDELAEAFSMLMRDGVRAHLTVAGEPWGGTEEALQTIRDTGAENHEIILGFLPEDQVRDLFETTDVIVVPYRRASASGPVNLAMEAGLPLVTTKVTALQEACENYGGVVFADVGDPVGLRDAMLRSMTKVGTRFDNPHSWDANVDCYADFFRELAQR